MLAPVEARGPSDPLACAEVARVAARHGFGGPERDGDRLSYGRGAIDCDQDVLELSSPPAPRLAPGANLREVVVTVGELAVRVRLETIDPIDEDELELLGAVRAALVKCMAPASGRGVTPLP